MVYLETLMPCNEGVDHKGRRFIEYNADNCYVLPCWFWIFQISQENCDLTCTKEDMLRSPKMTYRVAGELFRMAESFGLDACKYYPQFLVYSNVSHKWLGVDVPDDTFWVRFRCKADVCKPSLYLKSDVDTAKALFRNDRFQEMRYNMRYVLLSGRAFPFNVNNAAPYLGEPMEGYRIRSWDVSNGEVSITVQGLDRT